MDEVELEDTTTVSRADDVRAPFKEGGFLRESRNAVEPSESIGIGKGDSRRSSVRQFMDLLDGKDSGSTVNSVDMTQDPCTTYGERGEGRVEELTLGPCRSGQMMEEMLNEGQHGHQPETESMFKLPNHKNKAPIMSTLDASARERACQNANINLNLSNYNGGNESRRDAVSPGGMKMKIISKSTGCPEYFVKNTLKGKGVICKGPFSVGAEVKRQGTPCSPSVTPTPVNFAEKSIIPTPHGSRIRELSESYTFANDGIILREWIKSGKLQKVDGMRILKEILDLVHFLHSDGKVLVDLRPSCFRLLPSKKIRYCGRLSMSEMSGSITHEEVLKSQSLKRPLEQGMRPFSGLGGKRKKSADNVNLFGMKPQFEPTSGLTPVTNESDVNLAGSGDFRIQGNLSRVQHTFYVVDQLEERWYRTPEDIFGRGCTSSSNIFCLGVFLFELLSNSGSAESHAAAMSDLRHRILPPNFLSENAKEAGFCLWLLHPEPSLRPSARDILQSEVISGLQDFCGNYNALLIEQDEGESELLLHFLMSVKEQKQKQASKLMVDLRCIEADLKELEKRHLLETPMSLMNSHDDFLYAREKCFPCNEDIRDSRISNNVAHLEKAYFSARSQMHDSTNDFVLREDKYLLQNRENWCTGRRDEEHHKPLDDRGAFFDGLCKYARHSRLEVCGTLRNREITNSSNVICSLSFDRDEDYFAAAGVSKKIKIFDVQALCDDSVDIHYPMIEMSNISKLSCVCWNSYVRNYLASTDYDGVLKIWDASTGQQFSQYAEHVKRAWSVDFSPLDPTKLASGSDDCCVKLWNINEKNCSRTIRNIANVCCVQFSAHSSHLLAYGSADYKIYCYDLRNPNVPWCVLAGHDKAVSFVKFIDSGTLVSASTDNTLKLWDLSRSSSTGLSHNACSLTLKGHTNEKNFVGLSVSDGYLACGSETNEVYTYYKSLPMPITSHKFGSIDPISGKETDDDNGQFVSSVCWKGKSNQLIAANSSGCIKVLQMV